MPPFIFAVIFLVVPATNLRAPTPDEAAVYSEVLKVVRDGAIGEADVGKQQLLIAETLLDESHKYFSLDGTPRQ